MMELDNILCLLNNTSIPSEGFNLNNVSGVFWGKSSDNYIVFAIESKNHNIIPISQNTRYLKLFINYVFLVEHNGVAQNKNLSVLILKSIDKKYIELFVRLTLTLAENLSENKLLAYFMELKDLFANSKKASLVELQGLYGELFSMYVLKINYGVDISTYYQKEEKRKFDFSITDKKKIDVKTTTKPERTHHFLHMQLDIDRFDIKIISIMLQKDDMGMSLLDLITECKDLFEDNLSLIMRIESIIKNIDQEELGNLRFNYDYAKENMKIYAANDIPRLKEKNEEGVYNIEYDVTLSNAASISSSQFTNWLMR